MHILDPYLKSLEDFPSQSEENPSSLPYVFCSLPLFHRPHLILHLIKLKPHQCSLVHAVLFVLSHL